MAEEKKLEQEYLPEEITEKDVKKSWLTYYFFAETGISYERLQALGFCMSLIPISDIHSSLTNPASDTSGSC